MLLWTDLSPRCTHNKPLAQRSSVSQCKFFTPLPEKSGQACYPPQRRTLLLKIMPHGIPVTPPLEALWYIYLQNREHLQLTSTPKTLVLSALISSGWLHISLSNFLLFNPSTYNYSSQHLKPLKKCLCPHPHIGQGWWPIWGCEQLQKAASYLPQSTSPSTLMGPGAL